MGCKQSTTIRVRPVGQSAITKDNTEGVTGKEGSTQTPTLGKKALSSRESTLEFELDANGNKIRRRKGSSKPPSGKVTRSSTGTSLLSLDEGRSLDGDRGFSATSKASADSGLGDGGDDYAYANALNNIVTEYSEESDVKRVEQSFIERSDLDLSVTGIQLPTRVSAKDKTRQHESMILQSLREEGLIAKPSTQASGGMSFEIVTKESFDTPGLPCPPPRQLEKLERRRKKKKVLTEDEIRDKLERAEARRKKREEERLNKIKEIQRTDALSSLEHFEEYRKERQEQLTNQKMDVVADNRDKRMRDIKAKLQERERRAAEVRRRRKEALEKGLASAGVIDNEEEFPTSARDNPAFSQDD